MAYIRSHDTTAKRKGKVVKRYEVCWREPVADPATGLPTGRMRARQESYPTRETAEARRDALNAAKHTVGGTTAVADAKKAGELTFAHYAAGFMARQQSKVAAGKLKARTCERYGGTIATHLIPAFGSKAVAAITVTDCEQYRAGLLVGRRPRTVKIIWQMLDRVLRYAYEHSAIPAVPTTVIDRAVSHYAVGDDAGFEPHPLTAPQVAAVAAEVERRKGAPFGLLVLFMAYTGLRAAEVQGLEVRDLVITHNPHNPQSPSAPTGVVRVQRTKSRLRREWVTGTPKSKASKRSVPLPGWLAGNMADYLAEHPRGDEPTAPLWPRRVGGNQRRKPVLDWAEPHDLNGFGKKVLKPALTALSMAGRVRVHDLRHTAATLWLTNGVHFMQVAKWLGHGSYVLTMTVYADYMPEEQAVNPLPEPTAPVAPKAAPTTAPSNVVQLRPTAG
jgi:integrase